MIVSKRDPNGVVPFQVGGFPGLFPCPLDQWLEETGLTEDDLSAHSEAITITDTEPPAGATHTANAETASDISAAVTRKKDN